MSNVTSILGTNLISNAPSVLNANFGALNSGIATSDSSIVGVRSSIASKITISSTASNTLSITTGLTDKVMVWAKGTITGSTSSGSVALIYNGVVKDASTIKQAAAADETTFALMYSETPGAATANVVASVIATGALTITNVKIITEIIT